MAPIKAIRSWPALNRAIDVPATIQGTLQESERPQGIRQVWPRSAFAGGTMTNGAVVREQLLTGSGCRLRKTRSRRHDQDHEERFTDFQVAHPIHRTTQLSSAATRR